MRPRLQVLSPEMIDRILNEAMRILAELVEEVYTIEIVPELAESAAARLAATNLAVSTGERGWVMTCLRQGLGAL